MMTYLNKAHRSVAFLPETEFTVSSATGKQTSKTFFEISRLCSWRGRSRQVTYIQGIDLRNKVSH